MKKKSVQQPTAAPASGIKLRCDHREEEQLEYWPRPSELQLAELAARLARTTVIDPRQLVAEAWALYWESCGVIREDHKHVTTFFENEGRWQDLPDDEVKRPELSLPVPKRYPVPYREAELLLLPKLKGRTADRARVMREFLFADYVHSKVAEAQAPDGKSIASPTEEQFTRLREAFNEEAPDFFGQLRRMTFDKRDFAAFAEQFLTWHQLEERKMKSKVRAESARRSWEKRRREKKARTGARPKFGILRQIVESAAQPPLDGSKGQEKA